MQKLYLFLGIILLPIFFISCSDKLTNSKAEKIIREATSFPKTEDVQIQYGLFGYDGDSLPQFYYILQQEGMFSVEHLGKGGFLAISYRFRVMPTEKAKQYITEEDKNPVKQGDTGEFLYNSRFKTCEVQFDKVENIQEIPAVNGADARYTVKRTNFTPFWKYYLDKEKKMPDSIQSRKFALIKTNEGWKPAR